MSYPGGQQFDPYSGESVPHDYGNKGSTYRGFGAFDKPPPPNRKMLVIGVVAAVVAVGVAAGVFFLTNGDDGSTTSAPQQVTTPPVASSSAAPVSSAAPETSEPSPTSGNAKTPPVVDGWQAVVSQQESVAYDVSKDWEVASPGTLSGFEDKNGVRTIMHGVATYRSGFCEKAESSYRGQAGFMTAGDAKPAKVTPIAAKLWATAAAELPEDSDKVTASKPKRVDIEGGQDAWLSTATVSDPKKSDCAPDELTVTAVAFTPKDGDDTALFVVHADSGVDGELPAEELAKIVGSLRPAKS